MKQQRSPHSERAIVVGGSLAGMFAARVLRDHFEHVTVIDRDDFPQRAGHRAGVPQSHHAHGLLARGQQIIEAQFPGLMRELQEEGALETRLERLAIVTPAGKMTAAQDAESGTFVSRYLLEWKIRQRLLSDPRIHFVFNAEVVQLVADVSQRVTGVSLRYRKGQSGEASLDADLVVDASGRRSEAPRWLTALGYEAPQEETINSGVGYLSRFYRKPAEFPAHWDGIIINARPPHNPRAGLILPIEGERWHVTLGNYAGHYPDPETAASDAGFLEFARQLADPSIYEALRIAEPLTPVKVFRTPTNRLRHFERMQRAPAGFIAIGDSVCAFNPIYGQGMTTSALGSLVLAEALADRSPGFERRFQKALAQAVAAPWFIATSEDLRWTEVTLAGAPPRLITPILRRYVTLLLEAARTDPAVSRAYMRMLNMLDMPLALMRPSIVLRVLRHAVGRQLGLISVADEWALSPAMIAALRARTVEQG